MSRVFMIKITWGIGHLVELKEPKEYDPKWAKWSLASLPILPERYEFQVAKGKTKQFAIVKKLIKGTDTVINACDVDISLQIDMYTIKKLILIHVFHDYPTLI
jgi:DNA topoisomerase IA